MQETELISNQDKARSVFISFLGTGKYEEVPYQLDNKEGAGAHKTAFVQEAILAEMVKEGKKIDAYFILTAAARNKHFSNLKASLLQMPQDLLEVHEIDVTGENESDFHWELMREISNVIQEKDNLYVDITHSFRSIPLVFMSLANILHITKNVAIKAIFYGAFDPARYSNSSATDSAQPITPVINLIALNELQEWSLAIQNFIKLLDNNAINSVSEKIIAQLKRKYKGKNESVNIFLEVNRGLKDLSNYIRANRGLELADFDFNKLKQKLDSFCEIPAEALEDGELLIISQAFGRIREKLKPFSTKQETNFIYLAEWCLEAGLIQQAVTELNEGSKLYFIAKYLNPTYEREIFHSMDNLNMIDNVIYEKAWPAKKGTNNVENPNESFLLALENDPQLNHIAKPYSNFQELRNNLHHLGLNFNVLSYDALEKRTKIFLDCWKTALQIEEIIEPADADQSV